MKNRYVPLFMAISFVAGLFAYGLGELFAPKQSGLQIVPYRAVAILIGVFVCLVMMMGLLAFGPRPTLTTRPAPGRGIDGTHESKGDLP